MPATGRPNQASEVRRAGVQHGLRDLLDSGAQFSAVRRGGNVADALSARSCVEN